MIIFPSQISLTKWVLQNAHFSRERSEVREWNRLVHSHTTGKWPMRFWTPRPSLSLPGQAVAPAGSKPLCGRLLHSQTCPMAREQVLQRLQDAFDLGHFFSLCSPKWGIEWDHGKESALCIHLTPARQRWSWKQILVQTLNSLHDSGSLSPCW